MAIFDRHDPSMDRVKLSLIIIGALATVFGVEAQVELVHHRDSDIVVILDRGRVVDVPGLLTAITVVGRGFLERNVSHETSFAVSESHLSSARLQLLEVANERDVVFCSIGTVSPRPGEEASLNGTYSSWGLLQRYPYDWRVPCEPARIPFGENNASCALVLTAAGDLQLLDVMANEILWRSNTGGVGKANLTLDDFANLSLYSTDDGRTRWHSRLNDSTGYDAKCAFFLDDDAGKPSSGFQSVVVFSFLLPFLTSAALLFLTL